MSLYLCIFADSKSDEEIDGVEVGSYEDFHLFRTAVAEWLEGGLWASRFPVLMSHSDSNGEWSPEEAADLERELRTIEEELAALPPQSFAEGTWQDGIAKAKGLMPTSLAGCFIDVDAEPLLERLINLAEIAVDRGCAISFQ